MQTETVPNPTLQAVHLDTIGQIALTVRDLARSKQFYRDVLGMKFLFDAGQMAFFQCGSIRLMIGTGEPGAPVAPPSTILYFKVEDIQATYAALQAQSVPFLQEPHLVARMTGHDLWMAFLKDPDGNVLALMSEIPAA